jgi:hypothetical protein
MNRCLYLTYHSGTMFNSFQVSFLWVSRRISNFNWRQQAITKICGCYPVTFLNIWTSILIGVWLRKDQKKQTPWDWTLSLRKLLTTPYSIVSTIGRTNVFTYPISIAKSRKVQDSTSLCWCFMIDLLMNHKLWKTQMWRIDDGEQGKQTK